MAFKLAIMGCGNMGSAIARRIVSSGFASPSDMMVADVSADAARALGEELGCGYTCDNVEAARGANVVVVAVKPKSVPEVAYDIKDLSNGGRNKPLLVSIAAGVTTMDLADYFGPLWNIFRVMPNLAAGVGEAMCSISPGPFATSEEDIAYVKRFCECLGRAEVVDESLIDAVVALSGSAPAYVCLFVEALADAGVAEGMSRQQALIFAEQAVLGTAKYLIETGTHPAVLKDMVSSPAGTTIEAVASLERNGLRATVYEAARAAAARNRDM